MENMEASLIQLVDHLPFDYQLWNQGLNKSKKNFGFDNIFMNFGSGEKSGKF